MGGFNRFTGILDVVEADIRRRLPNKLIEDVIKYQREYHCLCWSFESVQFQEFLRTVLVERSAALGVPVPALPVIPLEDKALRIGIPSAAYGQRTDSHQSGTSDAD